MGTVLPGAAPAAPKVGYDLLWDCARSASLAVRSKAAAGKAATRSWPPGARARMGRGVATILANPSCAALFAARATLHSPSQYPVIPHQFRTRNDRNEMQQTQSNASNLQENQH